MKIVAIENIRGLNGEGLAITVVYQQFGSNKPREAFKTDGSATHWCWLEDGRPCGHDVWQFWEAMKVRNILAGKPAYECTFPKRTADTSGEAK
jgi:hypothetical protein